MKFAVVKCKISPEEFWRLSWFEFRMYVEKAKEEADQRKGDYEVKWDRTRILWSVLMNANFKKTGGGKFEPQDLIKLSFDKKGSKHEKPSLETFESLVEKHGKTRKKNGK